MVEFGRLPRSLLLSGLVQEPEHVLAPGDRYLQALLGLLARFALLDERTLLVPLRHRAPILRLMSDPLDSPRRKLERAEAQKETLYAELLTALDPEKHPVRGDIETHDYPKPGGVVDLRPWLAFTLVVSEVPTFNPSIGLLTGEVVHNFRGVLDHAVWSLVRRHGQKGMTESQKRGVQFPMSRSSGDFWNRANQRLRGLPREPYRTFIERYQPYHRSEGGRAMRWLRTLTDTDKHRLILPTVALPQEGNLNMSYEGAHFVTMIPHIQPGRAAKPGTKIMTLVLAGGVPGQRKVTVEGVIISTPIFPRSFLPPPPGLAAVSVEFALDRINATCTKFLEEVEVHL